MLSSHLCSCSTYFIPVDKRVDSIVKPTVPFVQAEVKYTTLHGYLDAFRYDSHSGVSMSQPLSH